MKSTLFPKTQHGAGFEPLRVRQFTVFLENRVGKLGALVSVLETANDPIRAMSIEASADAALVRLICADADSARETLKASGFAFGESDLLAVQLPKRNPQPLIAICSALLSAEISVHYVYPFLMSPRGPALAIYVDDHTLAGQVLMKKGFTLIGDSDLIE